jgi:hypothetical protein
MKITVNIPCVHLPAGNSAPICQPQQAAEVAHPAGFCCSACLLPYSISSSLIKQGFLLHILQLSDA